MTDTSTMIMIGLACLAAFAVGIGTDQYRARYSVLGSIQTLIMLTFFSAGWMAFFVGMFEWIGWFTLALVPVAVLGILFVFLVSSALMKMIFE